MKILEEQNKMTIFYNKRLGIIQAIVTGTQNMSYFGEQEEDFKIIYDYIVVDKDEYVINNSSYFIVINNALKLKDSACINKYL
ncbi:hypothetical protein ABFP60_19650 [Clostridioides difficile]